MRLFGERLAGSRTSSLRFEGSHRSARTPESRLVLCDSCDSPVRPCVWYLTRPSACGAVPASRRHAVPWRGRLRLPVWLSVQHACLLVHDVSLPVQILRLACKVISLREHPHAHARQSPSPACRPPRETVTWRLSGRNRLHAVVLRADCRKVEHADRRPDFLGGLLRSKAHRVFSILNNGGTC